MAGKTEGLNFSLPAYYYTENDLTKGTLQKTISYVKKKFGMSGGQIPKIKELVGKWIFDRKVPMELENCALPRFTRALE